MQDLHKLQDCIPDEHYLQTLLAVSDLILYVSFLDTIDMLLMCKTIEQSPFLHYYLVIDKNNVSHHRQQ